MHSNILLITSSAVTCQTEREILERKECPEIRNARIEELQAQIQAGTYQINSTLIARRLLGICSDVPTLYNHYV